MNTINTNSIYERKVHTIRKTAYIRFDLSERLNVINYINLVVSLILTSYLVGWSIFIAFFPGLLNENDKNIVSYIAVMATIALMLIAILDYMADRSVKARAFLDCGNSLLQIADDLEHAINTNRSMIDMKSIVDKYNSILSESTWNHSTEDNYLYNIGVRVKENKNFFKRIFSMTELRYRLLIYYGKRLSLQLAVALMVISPTIILIMRMWSQS